MHRYLELALLLMFSALPIAGQNGSESPIPPIPDEIYEDEIFGETVDVELINLRVWVDDRRDRPVEGLTRDAFEVRVDGQPVTISHFSELRDGRTAGATAIERVADQPAAEAAVDRPATEAQGHLVVYVDELHLTGLARKTMLKDLEDLLLDGNVDPERVLVLRQSGELLAEAPFGSSKADLKGAIRRLAKPGSEFLRASRAKQATIDRLWQEWELARQRTDRDPCLFYVPVATSEVFAYANQAGGGNTITMQHLGDTVRFMGGLEGAKILLYIGDVLDMQPGLDLMQIINGLCPRRQEQLPAELASSELSNRFEELTRDANASRVTIYSMQAQGLDSGFAGGAELASAEIRVASEFERQLRYNERSGLETLASRTGGEAMINRNRFTKELGAMADDLGTFYSLAFPPPAGQTQGVYRIDVKMADNDLKARYRRNFRHKTSRERLEDRVLSSIHLGVSPNPLGVRLGSGALEALGKSHYRLPLHVRLPVDGVTFLPTAEGELANLDVLITARSPRANKLPEVTRTFRFPRPQATEGLLDFVVPIDLEVGLYVIGVGVQDRLASQESYVSTTIAIGDVLEDAETPSDSRP